MDKTVFDSLEELKNEIEIVSEIICGNYCQYRNDMFAEQCNNCPLDKLYKN